jgi:CBS domain-containing protein
MLPGTQDLRPENLRRIRALADPGGEAMRVQQIMTARPVVVDATAAVIDAARQMSGYGVGVLPVVDKGALLGVVTDRDITERVVAAGLRAEATPVAQAMTPGAVTCFPDEDIDTAIDRMCAHEVQRLVVVDRQGGVVGLLSVDDLAMVPDHAGRTIAILQQPCRRWRAIEMQGLFVEML